jgi:hypothetical protein
MERGICKIVFWGGKGVGKFSVSSFKVFSEEGRAVIVVY